MKNANKLNAEILRNKKITLSTVKSFVKNASTIYVEHKSSFSGMTDMVEQYTETTLQVISKDRALGTFEGAYLVGSSRDYFKFMETDTHYGIKIFNCCGSSILWTNK